jgi:Tfp pilus assembly protein PilO
MSAQNGLLVPVIATGVAVLALMWFALIGPKRSENARLGAAVSIQEQRLAKSKQEVADFGAQKKRFPGMLIELRRLDIAVPARADIEGLLREVQKRARLRQSDLRLASLSNGSATASTGAPATTPPVAPGATAGPDGMATLPFTFSYTGRYFDLLKVLKAVRDAVTVQSGNLSIDGRLLTIDGISFHRPDPAAKLTSVVLSATAYIASDATKKPADAGAAPAQTADPAASAPAAATTTTKAGA